MSSGENVNDLFEAGLLLRLQRYLGLVKRTESEVTRRILLGILIGWFPLAVLSITQFLFLSGESLTSFFYDFSVYARFLVAVPALIFAETECVPRLGTIAN